MTPARCTVLADQAMPLAEADRGEIEGRLRRARDDLADAADAAERADAERRIAFAVGLLGALAAHGPS